MNIKIGDMVKSISGGYGPVLEIYQAEERLLYWIDFKYGYDLTGEGCDHKMWAGDVTLMMPGEVSVTRPCPMCGREMSQLSRQAKTCSAKCRKVLSRSANNTQDAIVGVSENTQGLNTERTKFTMPLMGELTIA